MARGCRPGGVRLCDVGREKGLAEASYAGDHGWRLAGAEQSRSREARGGKTPGATGVQLQYSKRRLQALLQQWWVARAGNRAGGFQNGDVHGSVATAAMNNSTLHSTTGP
jgi:hypothetical protein